MRSPSEARIERLVVALADADQRIAELEEHIARVGDLEAVAATEAALAAERDAVDAMASVDAPLPTAEGGQHVA